MAVINTETPKARKGRRFNKFADADVLSQSFDPGAHELVVKVATGAPRYKEDKAAAKFSRVIDSNGADPAPIAGTTIGFDLSPFSSLVCYWKNDTSTHTSINLVVYAFTDLGDWVQVGTVTSLAPSVETKIDGLGYRQIHVRASAFAGGAAGLLNLYVAGV